MYIDMDDDLYFSGTHYGIHSIKDFDTYGPRGFWDRHIDKNHSDFGNKSFDIGTATHELVLRGRAAYDSRIITPPLEYEKYEKMTKKASKYLGFTKDKETEKGVTFIKRDDGFYYGLIKKPWNFNAKECEEWKEKNNDKIILNQNELRLIDRMNDAVFETKECVNYFKFGHPEVGFRNTILDVPVQCKADWISTKKSGEIRAIIDIKTCISIEEFKKTFHKFGYWRQAAHYIRVVSMEIGRRVPFIFIAVEKNNPHRCELFEIDDDYLMEGDVANKKSYEMISEYLKSHGPRKPWPLSVAEQTVQTIEKPNWL